MKVKKAVSGGGPRAIDADGDGGIDVNEFFKLFVTVRQA